jgi:hypothetical protein
MSYKIREWLKRLNLFSQTTHEDRLEIDREIERRTGVECDKAVEQGRIDERTFKEIVLMVLRKKRKPEERKQEVAMVV